MSYNNIKQQPQVTSLMDAVKAFSKGSRQIITLINTMMREICTKHVQDDSV